jgi:hypothetical protein
VVANPQDRFVRDLPLEKYVDRIIEAKSIDTWAGSVAVIKDTQKKAPKTLGGSDFNFGAIKPLKGYLACLLPNHRYAIVINMAAWEMMQLPNQKLGLLYLLDQVASDEKTGGPTLAKHDIKGFKRFIKKYGMDWVFDQNALDPLDNLAMPVSAGVEE